MFSIERYHDISCGHRVAGHENKCAHLHGHNYRITFLCKSRSEEEHALDRVGRIVDFSVVKHQLCDWLEDNWDHKFLAWEEDDLMRELMPPCGPANPLAVPVWKMMQGSVVFVPFNPTAENMAQHLVCIIGPQQLVHTNVYVASCKVEETRKCSATFTLTGEDE